MDQLSTAAVLGVVEGLTEFLPVSSTGHLILAGEMLNFLGDKAKTFEIVIQSGAILAVLILYWRRFYALLDFKSTEGFKGKEGIIKLSIACMPAFVFGALLAHKVKDLLFFPKPVALALIAGGFVMFFVESNRPKVKLNVLDGITRTQALIIGTAQCLALWPGISRSGATIVAGMLLGLHRAVAAEFSFLVAAPVLIAATGYELMKSIHMLSFADVPLFLVGFGVSFVAAVIAVKGFIKLLGHWTLRPFAAYRIILGIIVLLALVK